MAHAFDAFLSHSHADAVWAEDLARRLVADHKFKVWLDRWVLIPGQNWQQAMAKGLAETSTCVVCVSRTTPHGWFQQEIERALSIQANHPEYRVIPALLPNAPTNVTEVMSPFLDLRTWADFREGNDLEYAFRVLTHGIKGEPVGPWPPINFDENHPDDDLEYVERKLKDLAKLKPYLHEEVVIEYERRILSRRFP